MSPTTSVLWLSIARPGLDRPLGPPRNPGVLADHRPQHLLLQPGLLHPRRAPWVRVLGAPCHAGRVPTNAYGLRRAPAANCSEVASGAVLDVGLGELHVVGLLATQRRDQHGKDQPTRPWGVASNPLLSIVARPLSSSSNAMVSSTVKGPIDVGPSAWAFPLNDPELDQRALGPLGAKGRPDTDRTFRQFLQDADIWIPPEFAARIGNRVEGNGGWPHDRARTLDHRHT